MEMLNGRARSLLGLSTSAKKNRALKASTSPRLHEGKACAPFGLLVMGQKTWDFSQGKNLMG